MKSDFIKKSFHKRGFTIAELLVVVAIIAVITAVALANYKNFNSQATLANTAYNLALTIHQAQLYGISVKETSSNSDQFQSAYGIDFSSPNSYVIYEDAPQGAEGQIQTLSYKYDSSNPQELVTTTTFPSGFTISKICFLTSPDITSEQCDDPSTANGALLDIEFVRPNPDAYMTTNIPVNTTGGNVYPTFSPTGNFSSYYAAHIYLTSGTYTRSVLIDKTGEVSVE